MKPKVSIIMPCYNSAPWIGQALESVLRQSDPAWELLVMDNGSQDGSREIVAGYAAREPRIRPLPNAHAHGPGGARNTGIEEARADHVMFLDSDDILFPGAAAGLHAALTRQDVLVLRGTGSIFCHSRWLAIATHRNQAWGNQPPNSPMPFPPRAFWSHIYNREFLLHNGIAFPEDLIGFEDKIFLCQVYAKAQRVPLVDVPVITYRINHKPLAHSASKSEEFMLCHLRIRALFEAHGRSAWVAPFLAATFFSEWLHHLDILQGANKTRALWFMDQYRQLVAGQETALNNALEHSLGESAAGFSSLCAQGDSAGMLALLRESRPATALADYMGVEPTAGKRRQALHTFARRAANLARTPLTAKTLLHFTHLHLYHKWRMFAAPQTGASS